MTVNDVIYLIAQGTLFCLLIKSVYAQFLANKLAMFKLRSKRKISLIARNTKILLLRSGHIIAARVSDLYYKLLKPGPRKTIIRPDSAVLTLTGYPPSVKVRRGEGFMPHATLAWTIFSVLYIEINSQYKPIQGTSYSLLILVLNIVIITWLCFYSAWFRNRIAGVINHRTSKPD